MPRLPAGGRIGTARPDDVGNPGTAFPEALMSGSHLVCASRLISDQRVAPVRSRRRNAGNDRVDSNWVARVGDIPDLMRRAVVAAQHVEVPRIRRVREVPQTRTI